ncbi:MAG: hypothetical protein L0G87_00425 [Renibacterium salmoninarum]|nr:hypothetical protein [Renibacterium salmoninarum]
MSQPHPEIDEGSLSDTATIFCVKKDLDERFIDLDQQPFDETARVRLMELLSGDFLKGQAAWERLRLGNPGEESS